jgi:alpha-glucosidase (family GH31 glycosyl hydrolase)
MFIHNPQIQTGNARTDNRAWGQFDLRGEDAGPPPAGNRPSIIPPAMLPTRGTYIPRPDTLNQAPTAIFLMALDTPADALTEYTHLFGNAAMPPKWTMGYMQSHRSLAGPDEVMAVAKRFRDDKLPCDALIYLGTGYTISARAGTSSTGRSSLIPMFSTSRRR